MSQADFSPWLRAASVAACGVLLIGCNPISGRLDVNTPTSLNTTRTQETAPGCDQGDRAYDCESVTTHERIIVAPGSHAATLNFDNQRKVTLTLASVGGIRRHVDFVVPADMPIPRQSGSFELPAGRLGQPVSLEGDVNTRMRVSEPRYGWELCSYTVTQYGCRRHKGGRRRSDEHCGYRRVVVTGERPVDYDVAFTTRQVSLRLLDPESGAVVAAFTGAQTSSRRRVHHIGACR